LLSNAALNWLSIILSERYGYSLNLLRVSNVINLYIDGSDRFIVFDTFSTCFYKSGVNIPFTYWCAEHEAFTSIYNDKIPSPGVSQLPYPLVEAIQDNYFIHYDILGLIYWVLSRKEEIDSSDLDRHDRFLASSSHAFIHGYLERPIIDEWLYILGQIIKKQWPSFKLKKHAFTIKLSHDVDVPSRYAFSSSYNFVKRMLGDLVRGNYKSALTAPYVRLFSRKQLLDIDPFNTFDWIMDQSDHHNLISSFYFIAGRSSKYNPDYNIRHPAIKNLMLHINSRGHEIGLHPSYDCYNDFEKFYKEANQLLSVCKELNIYQSNWGGRMHYLRWRQPHTLRAWDYVGAAYDASMTFPDHIGFRCGTCFDYPAFDAELDLMLNTRVRPLLVMERTVFDSSYMGLNNSDDAFNRIVRLKHLTRKIGGTFSMLWHNCDFATNPISKSLYLRILSD